MSSTNKTPNLGLCQWEATDPFLREDMNGDFAKIDEAIKTRTTKKKLFDMTVEENVPLLQLDFTGIDITQFMELEIFLKISTDHLFMRINGNGGNVYDRCGTTGSSYFTYFEIPNGLSRLSFGNPYHVFKPAYPISLVKMDTSTFPNIDSIELFGSSSGNNIFTGYHIIIWGVLK